MAAIKDIKTSVGFSEELFDKWVEDTKKQVGKQVSEAVHEHAEKVLETAKQLVPVKEGILRDSLHVDQKEGSQFARVRTGPPAYHAHLVHFGTSRGVVGNPFLYKAADRHAAELAPAIESKVTGK
jgi:hypothetical protein